MNEQVQTTEKPRSLSDQLRLEGKLTDAVIIAEGVEFPVHKIILCNCTPYFWWVGQTGLLSVFLLIGKDTIFCF